MFDQWNLILALEDPLGMSNNTTAITYSVTEYAIPAWSPWAAEKTWNNSKEHNTGKHECPETIPETRWVATKHTLRPMIGARLSTSHFSGRVTSGSALTTRE